jgi:prevent-host-death family protein
MKVTNIHEAKTTLSKLIDRASRGEEIVIGKAGKPIAKLVPFQKPVKTRVPGPWKGKVTIADDFDELPAGLAKTFRGERK